MVCLRGLHWFARPRRAKEVGFGPGVSRRDGREDTEGKVSPHPFSRAFGGKELNLRADVNGDRREAATVQALQDCLPRGRVVTVTTDSGERRAAGNPPVPELVLRVCSKDDAETARGEQSA